MKYEKSCGFVVFRREDGEARYLLIRTHGGEWGFPKGHVEAGETELQTACRELLEETGVTAEPVAGFRQAVVYAMPSKPGRIKQAVYFLGEYAAGTLRCQPSEVAEAAFLPYEEARARLSFETTREVLASAEAWRTGDALMTERLLIRPLEAADWRQMQRILADFRQSPWAACDAPMPPEDAERLTAQFAQTGLFYLVRPLEAETAAGYVCFHQAGDAYDLGYCFHSDGQRRGYAFESISALMARIRATRGAAVFTAGTALANAPSCRLLEKLGFVCEGEERVSFDGAVSFTGGRFVRRAR